MEGIRLKYSPTTGMYLKTFIGKSRTHFTYADGIFRATGQKTRLYFEEIGCPIVGRISMDLIGVDITSLNVEPDRLELINSQQTIDEIADGAGTIGYEFLTSLGHRYSRKYTGVTK